MTGWHRFILSVTGFFRRRRAEVLYDAFPDLRSYTVCDLGGSKHFWYSVPSRLWPARVEVLNIDDAAMDEGGITRLTSPDIFRFEVYDGERIPRPAHSYDLLLCNSVLEHVPPRERAGLVEEMNRVSARLFLQTPAKAFPVDVHFLMPLVHWVPRPFGRRLAAISPWRVMSRSSRSDAEAYFDCTHLLTRNQLRRLFPDAPIHVERFLGMPKSYLVIVGREQAD